MKIEKIKCLHIISITAILSITLIGGGMSCSTGDENGTVLENTETLCSDGIDNDNNGYTDCDDFNCKIFSHCSEPETTPSLCNDGIDNDLDGFTDCDDFDCAGIGICP